MNLNIAIALSALLHVVLSGYAYSLEAHEDVEVDEAAFREPVTVQIKPQQADEVSEDGANLAKGVPEPNEKLDQQYGLILHRHISRAESYPRFARTANLEGRLLVEITVDRSGEVLDVKVRESSGHEILDDHTLETIRKLGRFPLPPQGLIWKQKTFVLPVSYKLS